MANMQLSKPQGNTALTPYESELDSIRGEIIELLPSEVAFDKFKRVTLMSIQANPDILNADKKSFFSACRQCAKDGLMPDGKEAAFTIFKNSVAYMPMVKGIKKQLWKFAEIRSLSAHVVYENDEFYYELGDNEAIKHKPILGNRGKPIAAYAIIKTKDGELIREVLSFAEIEELRNSGFASKGIFWTKWWGEMAKKSAIRRAAKYLDLSDNSIAQEYAEETPAPKLAAPMLDQKAEPVPGEIAEPLVSAAKNEPPPDAPNGAKAKGAPF